LTQAALRWSIVLTRWAGPGFSIPAEHSPPDIVRRHRAEIFALLDPHRKRGLRKRLEQVAPPELVRRADRYARALGLGAGKLKL